MRYPPTRTVDTVDTYGSVRVPDPYRWLEDLDSKEVADWVKAENAVTMPYLAALPGRDAIRERITALYNYARTSVPFWEGGRWWYTKNSGLQKQSVWYSRVTLTGAEEIDHRSESVIARRLDGALRIHALPDGRHFAYGLSEGGSDWVTLYVRDLDDGEERLGHCQVGQVQQRGVDERRAGLLLLAISRAGGRQASSRPNLNTRLFTITSSEPSRPPT